MDTFIHRETENKIDLNSQSDFLEDVYEDLKEMGPERIGGPGVTLEELKKWQEKI